jgi:hypothetical protein
VKNLIKNYISNEQGLVTIEWVGIAAVVVLAGVVISATVMHSTASTAGNVDTAQTAVGTAAKNGIPTNLVTSLTPVAH